MPTSGQGVSEDPCATTLQHAAAPTHQFQKPLPHTQLPRLACDWIPSPHCPESSSIQVFLPLSPPACPARLPGEDVQVVVPLPAGEAGSEVMP